MQIDGFRIEGSSGLRLSGQLFQCRRTCWMIIFPNECILNPSCYPHSECALCLLVVSHVPVLWAPPEQKLANLVTLACALQGRELSKLVLLYKLRSRSMRKHLDHEVTQRAGTLWRGATKGDCLCEHSVLAGAVWGRMGADQLGTKSRAAKGRNGEE